MIDRRIHRRMLFGRDYLLETFFLGGGDFEISNYICLILICLCIRFGVVLFALMD